MAIEYKMLCTREIEKLNYHKPLERGAKNLQLPQPLCQVVRTWRHPRVIPEIEFPTTILKFI